ncbi:MAG TPA: ribosome biogenesis GTP-binding protein YihA/YsxC [Bacilli bacterium]|nr:ribosome biogenesis GTP-binding protein YihA/YsxC [Bacilli bacterium]
MKRFQNTTFVASFTVKPEQELLSRPEVVFIGRSNVGKSSLINRITGRKNLAFTSSKPGFTRLLNYFNVNDEFYLVDAPGYGYTSTGTRFSAKFGVMMESYFRDNTNLKQIYLLIDARRKPTPDDLDFLAFVVETNYALTVIFTKSDKLNQSGRAKARKNFATYFKTATINYLFTSSLSDENIDKLKQMIISHVKL